MKKDERFFLQNERQRKFSSSSITAKFDGDHLGGVAPGLRPQSLWGRMVILIEPSERKFSLAFLQRRWQRGRDVRQRGVCGPICRTPGNRSRATFL
jgi:hypothetical protein